MRSPEQLVLDALSNRFFAAVAVPLILTVMISIGRAVSRPGGPGPWTVLAKFKTSDDVRVEDRAIGLDLVAAATGSQLALLAAYQRLTEQASADNSLLAKEFGFHIRQLDLSFLLLGFTLLIFAALITLIRHKGYYGTGDMREDVGCHVPNWFGYGVLMLVYGLNPVRG